jgi:hypothetical protein
MVPLKEAMGAQHAHGWDMQGRAGKWAVCIDLGDPTWSALHGLHWFRYNSESLLAHCTAALAMACALRTPA